MFEKILIGLMVAGAGYYLYRRFKATTSADGASCGCVCVNGTEPCNIGQTCFWFNQGCSIGCPTCTGVKARAQVDICGNGMKARVCDERNRTYNAMAPCNSDKDTYKHNPWRAPGTAPGESLFTRSAML